MNRIITVLLATSIAFSACDHGADEVPAARLRDPAARARGAALFAQNCALCHGVHADGHGVRQAGFPRPPADLTDPAWQRRVTPREVFDVISHGKAGTGMPAWVGLERDQIWDLVAYVLSLGRKDAS